MSAKIITPIHPYFPEGVTLSGNEFVPNNLNAGELILRFGAVWATILAVACAMARKINPRLSGTDQVLVLWFVLSGSIHVFFEGYFVFNNGRMASMKDFFGQLWKEYALSDSRYMSSDPLVLVMESLTMITWGPLSFLTAILITKNSQYRHAVQALVSTGQFYGNLIYYITSLYEDFSSGKQYYRPEPYYFWLYFIIMNTFWLVVPAFCLYSSIKASGRAFAISNKLEANGNAKKRS